MYIIQLVIIGLSAYLVSLNMYLIIKNHRDLATIASAIFYMILAIGFASIGLL